MDSKDAIEQIVPTKPARSSNIKQPHKQDSSDPSHRLPEENPNPVFQTTKDGCLTFANDACTPILKEWECNRGDLIPANQLEHVHTALDIQQTVRAEVANGERVYLFDYVPDVASNLVNVYGFEITSRKKTEVALRESEERFRTLVEWSLAGVAIFRQDGSIYGNPRFCEMLGITAGQLEGLDVFSLVHPEDREMVRDRATKRLQGIPVLNEYQFRIKRPDGQVRWLHVISNLVEYENQPTLLATLLDVTEAQALDRKAKAASERLRLLIETMHDGLVMWSRQGRIQFVNQNFCSMTGYRRQELVRRPLSELFVGSSGQIGNLTSAFESDDTPPFDATIKNVKGETLYVSIASKALVDEDGAVRGRFAVITDKTELTLLRRRRHRETGFEGFVGRDVLMLELYEMIEEVAPSDWPVLIEGETGSGKELAALAIHNCSRRKDGHFVPVNCSALSPGLLESELFGHVRGAFTGAVRAKKGRFELAHRGTIFLDEVGELDPTIQVKLLRVLQEGTMERVGSEKSTKVDVRIISATNRDLEREVAAGRFRKDLYYRLCVLPLKVPALRERTSDISLLAEHFIKNTIEGEISGEINISPQAQAHLINYTWPGNVRELQNAIQYAAIKSRGKAILPQHLPPALQKVPQAKPQRRSRKRKIAKDDVLAALKQTDGNKLKAAKLLGVSRSTLYRFIEEVLER